MVPMRQSLRTLAYAASFGSTLRLFIESFNESSLTVQRSAAKRLLLEFPRLRSSVTSALAKEGFLILDV